MRKIGIMFLVFIFLMPLATSILQVNPSLSEVTESTTTPLADYFATEKARTVYNDVSETIFHDLVRELSEGGPRPEGTTQNAVVNNWIVTKLDEFSEGQIESEIFGEYESVIGKLPGTLGDDGPCVIIGGHSDTIETSPGANDNGVGVATALELARVLSKHTWPLDIYFQFWNAEETGLHGSQEWARYANRNDIDILIVYNIDMLFVQDTGAPADERVFLLYNSGSGVRFWESRLWAELARAMNHNFDSPVVTPVPRSAVSYYSSSDHTSFINNGYDSVIFAHQTATSDPYYHTNDDTWDNSAYDYGIAADTVASIGSAVAFVLSQESGELTRERHSLTIEPSQTDELLIEISTETWIGISGQWATAQGVEVTVIDPNGEELGSMVMSDSGDYLNVTTNTLGLHRVILENSHVSQATPQVEFEYKSDIRGDGVPDNEEWWNNEVTVDSDGDGISDPDELEIGSNPNSNDTDLDGIDDYSEVYIYQTNPTNNDTDHDLMPDKYEIDIGLDPTEEDADEDPDRDGLINLHEYGNGTLPFNEDSDHDGMHDGWEIENGLNPLLDDASLDNDQDGMLNLQEFLSQRDPNSPDFIYEAQPLDIYEWLAVVIPLVFVAIIIRVLWKSRK